MIRNKTVVYQGQAGAIDCAIDWPSETPRGWALVLHPNPVQGGTRDNKVVTTIARSCVQDGLVAIRPNFRGIGESDGEFDNGKGEAADMLAVVQQFSAEHPEIGAEHEDALAVEVRRDRRGTLMIEQHCQVTKDFPRRNIIDLPIFRAVFANADNKLPLEQKI